MSFDRIGNHIEALTGSLDRLEAAQMKAQAAADERAVKSDERAAKADERIAQLERLMAFTIGAGRSERRELRDRINSLVNAQTHTEDVLTEFVEATKEKFALLSE